MLSLVDLTLFRPDNGRFVQYFAKRFNFRIIVDMKFQFLFKSVIFRSKFYEKKNEIREYYYYRLA